jgi:hypothetical protein
MERKIASVSVAVLLLLSLFATIMRLTPTVQAYDEDHPECAEDLYSTTWLMNETQRETMWTAFLQVYGLFGGQVYNYWVDWWPFWPVIVEDVYGHRNNYYNQTTYNLVTDEIGYCEDDHEFSSVFYYGHMDLHNIIYNGDPLAWPWYNYGFREAASPDAETAATIWDANVSGYTVDNHHFVFLWVCNNGNIGGAEYPLYGMPRAWTHHNLNPDGYHNPDSSGYSFIGFENASADFIEYMDDSMNNTFKQWLVFFYYYALDNATRYTINEALDLASIQIGNEYNGWDDSDNRLYYGYDYSWFGGGGQPPIQKWGKMRIYGDGNIYLPVGEDVYL